MPHERKLIGEFVERFKDTSAAIGTSEPNPFTRKIMVDRPLRGLGANTVLVGKGTELDRWQLGRNLQSSRAARTLLIVLALDSVAHTSALDFQNSERDKLVVFGKSQLESLVTSPEPHDTFLQFVRDQVSFLSLVPFETSAPACGPQFTGRSAELRAEQSGLRSFWSRWHW